MPTPCRPSRPSLPFGPAKRALAAALLVVAVAAGCSSPADKPAPAPATRPRVVVLGLDAGTWDLLGPMMDRGLLPNLARLRAEGAHGPLRSTQPSSSPVIWTSIATGKVPEKTGITWFVRFPEGPGKPVPVDRRQRHAAALWNMLSRENIDVAVVGWYVTWPAEQVFGRLVSDIAHYGNVDQASFPDQYLSDLHPVPQQDAVAAMPRFMDWKYDPARAQHREGEEPTLDYLVHDRFVRAWTRDRFYLEATDRVLRDGPLPEALFVYLRGTDDVQHGFWKFMDPGAFTPRNGPDGKPLAGTTTVDPAQAAAFGKVIERYWQWTDEEVGRLLARYGKDQPLVVVCSDHGAGPAVGEAAVDVPEYLHLSGAHRIDGFLIVAGPGVRRGARVDDATIYDVAPTVLHALGLPVGRDMDGKVLRGVFDGEAATRPDAWVETWDRPEDKGGAAAPAGQGAGAQGSGVPADVDSKQLEHLRSLGYIGD